MRDEKFYGRAKERKTINFLQKRYVFFAISIAVIAAGFIGMGVHKASGQNSLNYGLDFMGGTSTTADFGEEYTIEDIENKIIHGCKRSNWRQQYSGKQSRGNNSDYRSRHVLYPKKSVMI